MYRLIPVILVFLLSITSSIAQQKPLAAPRYVPDVVVLVFSGVLSVDTVSFTYNKAGTTKQEAEQDVRMLESLTQVKFNEVKITSEALPPSKDVQTSSEFQVNGFVNYPGGALVIEPFLQALKRYKNIEIDYIINRKFEFRGLREYDDKHVSVKLTKPYQYRVTVKDPNFTTLNLPLVVQPKTAQNTAESKSSGKSNLLAAMGIACAAGVLVYFGARRFSKTSK